MDACIRRGTGARPIRTGIPDYAGIVRSITGARRYLRANPQAAVLLGICVVFGLGMIIVAVLALASSGSGANAGQSIGGDNGGVIAPWHAVMSLSRAF